MRYEWTNSRGTVYRMTSAKPFEVVSERPNGDPMIGSQAAWRKAGMATALSRDGYTYLCGLDPQLTVGEDGTHTYAETRHGRRRVWHRDPDGRWTEDLSAATIAHANAQTPEVLRGGTSWRLRGGKAFDRSQGRGVVYDTCKRWPAQYRQGEAWSLWITGQPGRGKSQLASWILADLAAIGVQTERIVLPELIRTMRAGYSEGQAALGSRARAARAVEVAIAVPVLCLEDVSADRQAEDVRQMLYAILDARVSAGRQTIYTDNSTPEALAANGFDPRIASRCSNATVLQLNGPDFRASQALL